MTVFRVVDLDLIGIGTGREGREGGEWVGRKGIDVDQAPFMLQAHVES